MLFSSETSLSRRPVPAARLICRLATSPAAWFFAGTWALAAGYVAFTPLARLVPQAGGLLAVVLFLWFLAERVLPVPVEAAEPPVATPGDRPGWRLTLQLTVLMVIIFLTALSGMEFHRVLPAALRELPVWSPLVRMLEEFALRFVKNDNLVVNPIEYVVLPGVLLLALGARPRHLGFGRGRQSWAVAAVWASPYLLGIALSFVNGLGFVTLLNRFFSNALQNGPMEEFLFRGALQTRLSRIMASDWAVVLSAVLFGLWHLGAATANSGGGDYLAGAALTVLFQSTMGLAFGLIYRRTGNLLAPSIVHILGNSL